MSLQYKDQVAIVTGAGAGLGKAYAHMFAARGAKVVVNDLGKDKETGRRTADIVVEEIKAKGGVAVANYDSVVDGDKVVKTAIDNFGTVHIIVNNAGILRDVGFRRMTPEQFDIIMKVHVYGAFNITKAAWPYMYKQQYGRIVMITSINGIRGQRGQVNYSTAKAGLIGMGKALAKEGAKKNIKVNIVAPSAGSQMTATILPPHVVAMWKPEYVSPIVGYLCHEEAPCTGRVFEAGGGWFGEHSWSRSKGAFYDLEKPYDIEDVKSRWAEVTDTVGAVDPDSDSSPGPALQQIMARL